MADFLENLRPPDLPREANQGEIERVTCFR